ncbi:MAG: hypothetical protein GY738_17440 [Pseudoalteromonas sp.]|nr:hypothetical protein [Pseudoalteromonas sp.]
MPSDSSPSFTPSMDGEQKQKFTIFDIFYELRFSDRRFSRLHKARRLKFDSLHINLQSNLWCKRRRCPTSHYRMRAPRKRSRSKIARIFRDLPFSDPCFSALRGSAGMPFR